jgi:hypothetical protein
MGEIFSVCKEPDRTIIHSDLRINEHDNHYYNAADFYSRSDRMNNFLAKDTKVIEY